MAYIYMDLLKNATISSRNCEFHEYYAILEKTCKFITFYTKSVASQLEKLPSDFENVSKMAKIISDMEAAVVKGNLGSVGLVYFKKENEQVFPKVYFEKDFSKFISDNFTKPVLLFEGTLELKSGSSFSPSLKSKQVYKSYNFSNDMQSFTLTKPFPFEMVEPAKECRWILKSFSLSLKWEYDAERALKQSSNKFLQNLFEDNEDSPPKDFVLVAANEAEIFFHGFILAGQSPAFGAMVNGAMKERECKRIELKMFCEETLNFFVRYIYCQAVPLKDLNCATALELFRLGHMYQLPEMTKSLSKMMLKQEVDWFSPDCILELYFLLRDLSDFKDLADHMMDIMLKIPNNDLRQCERYKELELEEANALLWLLLGKFKGE